METLFKSLIETAKNERNQALAAFGFSILIPVFLRIFRLPLSDWSFYITMAVELYCGYYYLRFIIRNADW